MVAGSLAHVWAVWQPCWRAAQRAYGQTCRVSPVGGLALTAKGCRSQPILVDAVRDLISPTSVRTILGCVCDLGRCSAPDVVFRLIGFFCCSRTVRVHGHDEGRQLHARRGVVGFHQASTLQCPERSLVAHRHLQRQHMGTQRATGGRGQLSGGGSLAVNGVHALTL